LLQSHEHIVNLIEVFRHDQRVYIVFEQLQRTLLEEIQGSRGLKELEAKKIIYQMMKACHHMHRDIKPENMLMSRNGVLKVCDMGFARYLNNTQPLSEYVSTRWYRAPEILVSHANTEGIYIWAIGCIFCELLTNRPLFAGKMK
jgi:serine/threonine protein kinase